MGMKTCPGCTVGVTKALARSTTPLRLDSDVQVLGRMPARRASWVIDLDVRICSAVELPVGPSDFAVRVCVCHWEAVPRPVISIDRDTVLVGRFRHQADADPSYKPSRATVGMIET